MKHAAPLVIENLTKQYGKARGIEDVSLSLQPGEIFGFLGPNGAGKTTTIRTIMNFLRPSRGTVKIFGLNSVHQSVEIHKRVGYLAGDFELYDNLTATQYFNFMAHLHGNVSTKKVQELIERLEVTVHQRIKTLSRGNKQKVGLVAALMHEPELLVLDEPTSGLDPLIQNQFYELVREHCARGKTVFMSSHILSEVQTICGRVGFMREGRLVETVSIDNLRRHAKRDITVTCKPGTKPMRLPSFKGLEILEQTKTHLRFLTDEPVKRVLSWLAVQPIENVAIQETNLDDVFLRLYSNHEEVADV